MTTIKTAGFICQDIDGYAIHGIGTTEAEAWAETCANCGPFEDNEGRTKSEDEAREGFKIYPATSELLEAVDHHGGAITWDIINGIACNRGKVFNVKGEEIDFEAATQLMDDDLREAIHTYQDLEPQAFIETYAAAHAVKFGEDFVPYAGGAW